MYIILVKLSQAGYLYNFAIIIYYYDSDIVQVISPRGDTIITTALM